MTDEECRTKIQELKLLVEYPPIDDEGESILSDWELHFIEDKNIFIEELGAELGDALFFTLAVKDKVEEIYEKYKDYL